MGVFKLNDVMMIGVIHRPVTGEGGANCYIAPI